MRTLRTGLLLCAASSLWAWNAAGHKTIAFIAYHQLSARARANVDRLLQSHPDYLRWVEGIPAEARPLDAFLHASVWADEIKSDPGYRDEPRGTGEVQPPAFPDRFRHRDWHYIDTPLVGEFASLRVDDSNKTWRNHPTALSQTRVMENILRDRKSSDAAKAWALAWMIHLVGDLHQPLHCASRYTTDAATGKPIDDQGGNRVRLSGKQTNLHAFWDDALDDGPSTAPVQPLGTDLIAAFGPLTERARRNLDVSEWVNEGARLSIGFVYAGLADAPSESGAIRVPAAYRRVAQGIAEERATLGGYRLAGVLNKILDR